MKTKQRKQFDGILVAAPVKKVATMIATIKQDMKVKMDEER